MNGPWDGFGSPPDCSIVHIADLFEDYTACGLPRRDGAWTSVTTRTTCALCNLANAAEEGRS